MRFLLPFLLFFFSSFSWSAGDSVSPQYGHTQPNSGIYSSESEALSAGKSVWDARWSSSVSCRVWTDGVSSSSGLLRSDLSGCASGGVAVTVICPSGYSYSKEYKLCITPDYEPELPPEPEQCLSPNQMIRILQPDGSINSECHSQCKSGYQRVELSASCEKVDNCPVGFPVGYNCNPPFEDPEGATPPSCGLNEQAVNEGSDDMFCISPDPEYDPNNGLPDPTDPENPRPEFPDPQPDTGGGDNGGGDTGGGDTGGGDTGGGDTGGSLNCPSGFIESNGVCVSSTDGGLNCPIGTSEGKFEQAGSCVPDDCPAGQYMTAGGCTSIPVPTPPTENTDFDDSGIIAAIKDQTYQVNRNTTDTAKAGTFSIVQNDNKIAKAHNQKLETEADKIKSAVDKANTDIVSALSGVKQSIDDKNVSGGGGDGETPPVDCGEGNDLCPPEEPDPEFAGGVGGTVGTEHSSFQGVNQAFFNKIKSSEFGQVASNLPNMFEGSGSCPVLIIDLPDPISHIVSTDLHCTIMADISGLITAVMMVIYTFYGFRILFGA